MSKRVSWSTALENSSGAAEVLGEAPVAEFEINVNEVDEDGAPLEAVDAEGNPTVDVTIPETAEMADEIETAEDVVEQLEDTSEVLESLQAEITSAIENNGGLTQQEYRFAMIALRSRIPEANKLVPSQESFGYNRLSASTEMLDSIKEGIKSIWDKIKEVINKLITKVRNWFNKTLSDAARLGKRAKGIREALRKRSGAVKEDKSEIKVPGLSQLINKANKVGDSKYYLESSKKYLQIAEEILKKKAGKASDIAEKMTNEVTSAIDKLANAKFKTGFESNNVDLPSILFTSAMLSLLSNDRPNIQNGNDGTISLDDNIKGKKYVVEDLPGRKDFVYTYATELENKSGNVTSATIRKLYNNVKYHFESNSDGKELDTDQDGKPLAHGDIIGITENIEDMCNVIVAFKNDFSKQQDAVDKFVKKMDNKLRDMGKDSESKPLIVAFVQGSSDYQRNSLSNATSLITELLSKGNYLLGYCQRSASVYAK